MGKLFTIGNCGHTIMSNGIDKIVASGDKSV